MIYPVIYTRTRNKDYRLLTSGLLTGFPADIINRCRSVARAVIDAQDSRLEKESWVLVKGGSYILFGKGCLNRMLGHEGNDLYGRPVRGFFGFISDGDLAALPMGNKFFEELYRNYVTPVWDTFSDSEQVNTPATIPFGDELLRAEDGKEPINLNREECRIAPYVADVRPWLASVLAAGECSIATNLHTRKQIAETGPDFFFMNVIMAEETGLKAMEALPVAQLATVARAQAQRTAGTQPPESSAVAPVTPPPARHSVTTETPKVSQGIPDAVPSEKNSRKGMVMVWVSLVVFAIVAALILIFATDVFTSRNGGGNSGGSGAPTSVAPVDKATQEAAKGASSAEMNNHNQKDGSKAGKEILPDKEETPKDKKSSSKTDGINWDEIQRNQPFELEVDEDEFKKLIKELPEGVKVKEYHRGNRIKLVIEAPSEEVQPSPSSHESREKASRIEDLFNNNN